jgi:hypothetical protein
MTKLMIVLGLLFVGLIVWGAVQANSPQPSTTSAATTAPEPTKPLTEADRIEARKAYGKVIDRQLLELGIESETHVLGSKCTEIKIYDALAGRVRAHALGKNAALFSQLRDLGFKKLVYTDGDDFFTWDLTK